MVKLISDFSQIPQEGAIVIDFFATWCGPCKRIAPVFEDLADKFYPHIQFFKVDVDESPELVDKYSIQAMPTFLFLKNGIVVKKVEGADMVELEAGFTLLYQK
jgi:thioredoxin 1